MESIANKYSHSAILYGEARKYAPGGVHSNVRLKMKPFPIFFHRSKGARLWDVDGNEYVDYALGMGPIILGHADHDVNEAVRLSVVNGQLYAGQHEEEVALARTICELVPCAEMVRLSLSGSEAVQAALRLARAATGRQVVIKFEGHYHGWFDNIDVSVNPDESSMGPAKQPNVVPSGPGQCPDAYSAIRVLPWNDLDLFTRAVEAGHDEIAAVIMEPIMCNSSVIMPRPGFMEAVRELCSRNGIVLIFDEVITGFRVGLGGAGEHLGVKPDLAVFAKAMANGYPVSCLVGRRNLMELFASEGVVHAGTFNANRLSCAAALATLCALRNEGGKVYSRMRKVGTGLIEGLKQMAMETDLPLHIQGLPTVFHTAFTDEKSITDYRSYHSGRLDLQSQFVMLLRERGVYITGRGTWFLSAAHTDGDVEQTLKTAKSALLALRETTGPLRGGDFHLSFSKIR